MRRPLMAGNWKMYKTIRETEQFLEEFIPLVARANHCDVAIAPPFTALAAAARIARNSRVAIAAQDIYHEKEGAFTGQVAPEMLVEAGCRYAIIGHSERRQYFGETDESVQKKTRAALGAGLEPIACVGENLAEREAGQMEAVLRRQFTQGLGGLTAGEFARIIVAYEPRWAIGTGRTASPETAAEAHRLLRSLATERFGQGGAALRILYGGSVKPDNVRGLMAQPDIDGTLVGGASLDPKSFAAIVDF